MKNLFAGKHSCFGKLSFGDGSSSQGEGFYDRDVMLVYCGKFDSMDGEVEINEDHLSLLEKNHNQRVAGSTKLASGETNMADFPPLQLDHSTSAAMTIGRVPFPVRVGEYQDEGESKKALFGRVRFLGTENVEKAKDGRYTHVSIGADLENGILNELSVTPFPAAPNAALLGNKRFGTVDSFSWKNKAISIYESQGKFFIYVDGKLDKNLPIFSSKEDAKKYAQTKLSTGGSMDKEKLKKHLMEHHKMSAEDADKKMASMSDEDEKKMASEVDEKEKKMAADEEEKKKLAADETEHAPKEAAMAANKAKFVQLAKGFKTASSSARLNQKKGNILVRLSALKAKAKVTPAEIKSMDIARLAAKGDEAIEAVLDSYEKREPQVLVGLFGTQKAESIAKLAKKSMLNSLEVEARVQFSSNPKNKKFSDGQAPGAVAAPKLADPDQDGDEHLEAAPGEHHEAFAKMKEAFEGGHHEEAMAHMKHLGECLERMKHLGEEKPEAGKDAEAHMASMGQDVKTLQDLFDDLVKLSSASLGVDASEI